MPDRTWTTVFFPTPLIFRYHLPLMPVYAGLLMLATILIFAIPDNHKWSIIVHWNNIDYSGLAWCLYCTKSVGAVLVVFFRSWRKICANKLWRSNSLFNLFCVLTDAFCFNSIWKRTRKYLDYDSYYHSVFVLPAIFFPVTGSYLLLLICQAIEAEPENDVLAELMASLAR
jgi:hypothetical protein